MIIVNVMFERRNHPLRVQGNRHVRKTERQVVTDMRFDAMSADEISDEMIMKHPKALPGYAGWYVKAFSCPRIDA